MGGPLVVAPNWQNPAIPLQAGARITPLCNPGLNIPCLEQWTHLAQPFAVTAPGASIPTMEYFLPSILIDRYLPSDISMDEGDWELYTPSFPGSRTSSRRNTRYYVNTSDRGKIREVKTDEEGKTTIGEGQFIQVSEEAVEVSPKEEPSTETQQPEGTRKEKAAKEDLEKPEEGREIETPDTPTPVLPREDGRARTPLPSPDPPPPTTGRDETPTERRGVTDRAGGDTARPERGDQRVLPLPTSTRPPFPSTREWKTLRSSPHTREAEADTEDTGSGDLKVVITEDTTAVAAEVLTQEEAEKKPQGCVSTDPEAPENNPGDSFSCSECNDQLKKGLATVSPEQKESILQEIGKFLTAVVDGIAGQGPWAKAGSVRRIAGKINEGGTICSPKEALKKITNNFNRTCKPHTFEEFFPKAYCTSCQTGVPAEIMFSMMTIESAGECKAANTNENEQSFGLFQINLKNYQCNKPFPPDKICFFDSGNTKANQNFLLNPYNSLEYGIKILDIHYNEVNPGRDTSSSCNDKHKYWKNLTPTERDRWRRAVSGYNGRGGWVNRAIQSVEGSLKDGRPRGRDFSRNTKDLYGSTNRLAGRARQSNVNWENLRIYYFIEKLMPKNRAEDHIDKQKSGRNIGKTISNLAHTEAVLGREVEGSPPGIVEYWEQYIKQHKPKTCPGK